jgi:hypothetical protein
MEERIAARGWAMETVENSAKQLRRVFHSSHSPYCYLYLRKKNKEEKTLLWKV